MQTPIANPDNYNMKQSNPHVKNATIPQMQSLGYQVPFYPGGSGQIQHAMRTIGINPYSQREMTAAPKRRK
jgi:hypothetical protein